MANLKSFSFVLAAFAVALFLIIQGPKWANEFGRKYDRRPVQQPEVAQIVALEGQASRRLYGEDSFKDLTVANRLQNFDTVQLQARAKMQLTIGTYKLALQGPGLFVLELWQNANPTGPMVMHLISGEMYVLADGEPGKLYIVRDGEMLDPKGAGIVRERHLLLTPLNIGEPPAAPVTATPPTVQRPNPAPSSSSASPESQALTNEYLDGEIAKQAEQFQRCQNNALREQGEVKGQILIGLTITPDGKISQVRVLTSTLQDDKLHNCVIQVFQRLKFKNFSGAPIVRSYPLNFE